MRSWASSYGISMTILGILGYALTKAASVTALIPTFIGLPVTLLALFGRTERSRKHVMHAITLVALIALLGGLQGVLKVPGLLSGEDVARPAAVIEQSVMAFLSGVFVVRSCISFIEARRSRK
jgi:hypothetical protein